MSTIVTRAGKGSPLTNNEVDANFINLNTDKIESITSVDGSVVVSASGTTRDLSVDVAGSTKKLISQVRNETGATLTKGTVVYISGASGNKALVSKALANADATSAQTYGVVQTDISNNQNGHVVVVGAVSDLNTSAYPDGTQLYLSGTTAGEYTSTKPYAPIHLVYVAVVTRSHATLGAIEVKIQNGYELDELHDVSAQSPSNGQTIVYNSSTSLWEKSTAPVISGTTINNTTIGASTASTGAFTTLAASGAVTLSGGTVNGVTYLNGSKVLTSGSALTFDGTNLGLGTSSPSTPVGSNLGFVLNGQSVGVQVRLQNTSTGSTSSDGLLISLDGSNNGYLYNYENASLIFGTNAAEGMRLTSTGLGIGTTTIGSDFKTVVYGGFLGIQNATTGTGNNHGLYIGNTGTLAQIYQAENDALTFSTNATERFRVGPSGQLGIGGATYGTAGQVLTSAGSSAAPTWATPSGVSTGKAIAMAIVFGG